MKYAVHGQVARQLAYLKSCVDVEIEDEKICKKLNVPYTPSNRKWENISLYEEYKREVEKNGDKNLLVMVKMWGDNGIDITKNHMDCGMKIYDSEEQDTHAGGSGCACSALVLSSLILPKLTSGEWTRVLFVPTGALLSQVSSNEGRTIPSIAHAVWLETTKPKK